MADLLHALPESEATRVRTEWAPILMACLTALLNEPRCPLKFTLLAQELASLFQRASPVLSVESRRHPVFQHHQYRYLITYQPWPEKKFRSTWEFNFSAAVEIIISLSSESSTCRRTSRAFPRPRSTGRLRQTNRPRTRVGQVRTGPRIVVQVEPQSWTACTSVDLRAMSAAQARPQLPPSVLLGAMGSPEEPTGPRLSTRCDWRLRRLPQSLR